MRRIIFLSVMTVIIATIFVGFGVTKNVENNRAYAQYVQQGQLALKQGQYARAKAAFENALTKRNAAATPSRMLRQIKLMQRAQAAAKQGHYATAATNYGKVLQVKHGAKVMYQRARVGQFKMNATIALGKKLNKLYSEAKVLSNRYEYTASNAKLQAIFAIKAAKKKPFSSLYHKALQLYEINNTYLQQLDATSYSESQTQQANSADSEQGNLTAQSQSATTSSNASSSASQDSASTQAATTSSTNAAAVSSSLAPTSSSAAPTSSTAAAAHSSAASKATHAKSSTATNSTSATAKKASSHHSSEK